MTNAERAAELGICVRTWYNWQKPRQPKRETVKARAAALGISRRTWYRWQEEGYTGGEKRARGPKRNPKSKRYTRGRHSFSKTS